ncbi:MAG: MerR family transcriptional regulator [Pseudonocardia sp.]
MTVTDSVVASQARLEAQDAILLDAGATHTIAEIAELTGVSAHTLRYYERIGLLDVARDAAGHRVYGARDVTRVVFLSRLRMTGMPIRELQRYVELVGRGEETVPERLAMLQHHRDAIRTRIAELRFALDAVEYKITTYGGHCSP